VMAGGFLVKGMGDVGGEGEEWFWGKGLDW